MSPDQYELTLIAGDREIKLRYYGNKNIVIEYKEPVDRVEILFRIPKLTLKKFLEMIDE